MSMDYSTIGEKYHLHFTPSEFIKQFAFECSKQITKWDMEDPNNQGFPRMRAETNYTFHVIFIYLYSTLQLIVLSTIPYRYDRFMKTDKQKQIDKQKTLEAVTFLKFKLNRTRTQSYYNSGNLRSLSMQFESNIKPKKEEEEFEFVNYDRSPSSSNVLTM